MGDKKENVKKKVWFMESVKLPMEAGILCTIDGDTFYLFTKNTWIGDSRAWCHIANHNISLFNVIDINELIQESPGTCLQQKKRSFTSMYDKLMVTSESLLYGL